MGASLLRFHIASNGELHGSTNTLDYPKMPSNQMFAGAPGRIRTSDPQIRRLRGVCRPAVAHRDQVRTMTAGCESATALPVRPIHPLQHAGVSFGIREPFWRHDW